jgi:hypothetical protein
VNSNNNTRPVFHSLHNVHSKGLPKPRFSESVLCTVATFNFLSYVTSSFTRNHIWTYELQRCIQTIQKLEHIHEKEQDHPSPYRSIRTPAHSTSQQHHSHPPSSITPPKQPKTKAKLNQAQPHHQQQCQPTTFLATGSLAAPTNPSPPTTNVILQLLPPPISPLPPSPQPLTNNSFLPPALNFH